MIARWQVGALVLGLGTWGVAQGAAGPAKAPAVKERGPQPIRVQLRGGLTVAAEDFTIGSDGRVRFGSAHISLTGDRMSLRAGRADLEVRRPVTNISDLGGGNLAGATLTGGVICEVGPDRELRAETVKVSWSAPGEVLLEATGDVSARLPGVNIAGAKAFTLRFKVGPAPGGRGANR
jgi:hypothetical protein